MHHLTKIWRARRGFRLFLLALSLPCTALTAQPRDIDAVAGIILPLLDKAPAIGAANAKIEAAQSRLNGSKLPLNNPELEIEAERTDIRTYRLGISQTLDWHNKREQLERVARLELESAKQDLQILRLGTASELLGTIGRILTLRKIVHLSGRQVELLERFEKLVQRRYRAGDVSPNDLAQARLSLAEARLLQARRKEHLVLEESRFRSTSGISLGKDIELPDPQYWPAPDSPGSDIIRQHPEAVSTHLSLLAAQANVATEDLLRKADPSVGISAGREGGQSLIGLTFSMPLQVRNAFRSNGETARAKAREATLRHRQKLLELESRLAGAHKQYQLLFQNWQHWKASGAISIRHRADTLERLWKAGETSTSDYLFQLQQTLDARITAIEFEGDLWSAWVATMEASGRLIRLLEQSQNERGNTQ